MNEMDDIPDDVQESIGVTHEVAADNCVALVTVGIIQREGVDDCSLWVNVPEPELQEYAMERAIEHLQCSLASRRAGRN